MRVASSQPETRSARSTSLRSTRRSSSTTVEELRGDVRDPAAARRLARGADVVVHAAAALPIRGSASEITSVNVEGTKTVLEAALRAGVPRAIVISSTAVYGVPKTHPVIEDAPLEGVGHYGRSKIEAEEVARSLAAHGPEVVILRPKTFLGPERLGVFEILFDWIREGRRVPILGDGSNRYQLLDVDDLAEAVLLAGTKPVAGETLNIGATDFGTVRSDLEALIEHAHSDSTLRPVPARPAELALRALEVAHLSPLAEWHYKTAHRDSYVDVSRAAAAARLAAAPLQHGDADQSLRLVRRQPRAYGRRRHHASRPLEPAGPRPAQAPKLGRRGADRVSRALPDPLELDVPDQPFARADARGSRAPRPRVHDLVEHARDPRLERGLVGAPARRSATRSAG